jgi:hypothetical protein
MPDVTTLTQHLIEKILEEHDSHPEINRVLTNNLTFQCERESSKSSLVRLQKALKAMPKIIDEQGQAREPNSKGWMLNKINKPFKKNTGHSVDEIDNTKNLSLVKLLTRLRNAAAEILESVIDLPEMNALGYEQLKQEFDMRIEALFQAEMNHDN